MKRRLWLRVVLMMAMVFCFAGVAGAKATKAEVKAFKAEMAAYNAKMTAAKTKEVAAGKRAIKYRGEAVKAKAESAVNDKAEKRFAAGAKVAKAAKDKAIAKQDKVCKVVGFVPVVGLGMRLYNSGEMKASLAGLGNESYYGVKHVFFKLPAALPEHAVTDFVYQFTGSDWRELDPITVFIVDGRPYWMDTMVTGTKLFFGFAGAHLMHNAFPFVGHITNYAKHSGHVVLPVLGYTGPVGNAFLWTAAGGGSASLLSGTASQGFMGFKPYRQYYQDFQKWTGKPATMPVLL